MLDWLGGASHPDDQSCLDEPPETPAHLFAVKAFKSALWGTPAPKEVYKDEDESKEERVDPEDQIKVKPGDAQRKLLPALHVPKFSDQLRAESLASPTKGILLTPGTISSRRKTVSFGNLTQHLHELSEEGIAPAVSALPADTAPLTLQAMPELDLRRSLFLTRTTPTEPQTSMAASQNNRKETEFIEKADLSEAVMSDATIDLKNPRSKSGQHWMKEYQRDHDKSKAEMKQLIRYSQIAKSYAAKRDSEAVRLSQKLKKAELRAKNMEDQVSGLATQLGKTHAHGDLDAYDQADLLSELAKQTALAVSYKHKAENYKSSLRTHEAAVRLRDEGENEQVAGSDVHTLRVQAVASRKAAEVAEDRAERLGHENTYLKQTIMRVKEEMKRYEARHHAREERRKRRDDKSAAQKTALKEKLALSRLEHQRQIQELRDEAERERAHHRERLDSLDPIILATAAPTFTDHEKTIRGLQEQIQNLREANRLLESNCNPSSLQAEQRKVSQELRHIKEDLRRVEIENAELRLTAAVAGKKVLPDTSTGKRSQSLMAKGGVNIWTDSTACPPAKHNSGQGGMDLHDTTEVSFPQIPVARPEPSRATSTGGKDKDEIDELFPLPIQPLVARSQNKRNSASQSPRPSMINFPSSPPTILYPNDTEPNLYGPGRLPSTVVPSNRTSSLGRRVSLPPERAAAAKARLEQRNAEKQRARCDKEKTGKENVRPVA